MLFDFDKAIARFAEHRGRRQIADQQQLAIRTANLDRDVFDIGFVAGHDPRGKFEHNFHDVVVGMQFDAITSDCARNRMTDGHRRQIELDGGRRGRGYSCDHGQDRQRRQDGP